MCTRLALKLWFKNGSCEHGEWGSHDVLCVGLWISRELGSKAPQLHKPGTGDVYSLVYNPTRQTYTSRKNMQIIEYYSVLYHVYTYL